MATTIATPNEVTAAIQAWILSTPMSTKSATSGRTAKIALSASESPTGSRICLYIGVPYVRFAAHIPKFGPVIPGAENSAQRDLGAGGARGAVDRAEAGAHHVHPDDAAVVVEVEIAPLLGGEETIAVTNAEA